MANIHISSPIKDKYDYWGIPYAFGFLIAQRYKEAILLPYNDIK